MYDLNLSVPDLTSENYSQDNKFRLLKNYLYELNDMLAVALSESSGDVISIVKNIEEKTEKKSQKEALLLKSQSVNRFNRLKEEIIRTADEICESYKSDIKKTETEILSMAEKIYTAKTEFSEYKADVNTKFDQTAENIRLKSENTEDVRTDLENFKNSSRGELSISADAIISKVESIFQTKSDSAELEARISSEITQTEANITEIFSNDIITLSDDISTVGGSVNRFMSELDVYIRRGELSEGVFGIEIGRTDSNIKARFTNERLSFYQGLNEVAYISGSSLYITNADILDYLRIGNSSQGYFLFDTTQNGLEVRWIDAE